jgi:hypothetical protein
LAELLTVAKNAPKTSDRAVMTDGDGVASGSRSEALPPAEIMTKRLTVGRAVDSSKGGPKDEPESVGGLVIGLCFLSSRPLAPQPPQQKKERKE